MEGTERTPQGDKVLFAVIAIENAAKKLNLSTEELVNRLERQNLIEGACSAITICFTPKVRIMWLTI